MTDLSFPEGCSSRAALNTVSSRGVYWHRIMVVLIIVLHCGIVLFEGAKDGPGWDEVGHFAAGLEHWYHGRFQLFSVNPPLVRLVVLAPVALAKVAKDPDECLGERGPGGRPEFMIGAQIASAAKSSYFSMLTAARWTYLLFSLLAAWVCYRWSVKLWGNLGGLISLLLWCLSPTVLTFSHIITPDLGAAAVGIFALYSFRHWLEVPTPARLILAGIAIGLAELSKSTWLILIPLLPILWLLLRVMDQRFNWRLCFREGGQLIGVLGITWFVLNLGYGFEGSFSTLGTFKFISSPLGGQVEVDGPPHPGNRFRGTILEGVPVPLPANYLIGIDYMKWEFEHKEWSYLNGKWQLGGWWYYYIFGLAVKEPIGNWAIFFVATIITISCRRRLRAIRDDVVILLGTMTCIFVFVSCQTGFSHHIRYMLPAVPMAVIWMGGASLLLNRRDRLISRLVTWGCLGWSAASSLSVFPHHMSYFNEIAGGPRNGYKYLDDSNLDWGQDLHYVKAWYDDHPYARPFHLMSDVTLINPRNAGIDWLPVPVSPHFKRAPLDQPAKLGPQPGWYCISIKRTHANLINEYDYFKEYAPVDWVGDTMPVYYISFDEANRVRKKMKIPELTK
ncbi:MAG TPA: glycosyltransferase family 39 protein [Phycisphaerae bacterium]|nr:glycosyltransferase family 39 protein [Phycisphaerae bacterium]